MKTNKIMINKIKNLLGISDKPKINLEAERVIRYLMQSEPLEIEYFYIKVYLEHTLTIDYENYRILYQRRDAVKFLKPTRIKIEILDIDGNLIFYRNDLNYVNNRDFIEENGETSDSLSARFASHCDRLLDRYLKRINN